MKKILKNIFASFFAILIPKKIILAILRYRFLQNDIHLYHTIMALIYKTKINNRRDTIPIACFPSEYMGYCVITNGYIDTDDISFIKQLISIREKSEEKECFMDIGSNIGGFSFYLSKHVDTIHSFEPNPISYLLQESSILYNGFENIHLHKYGLGRENTTIDLHINKDNLGTSSFIENLEPENFFQKKIQLEIKTGDEVCTSHHIEPTIIKIDVQGFELDVIQGLKNTLTKYSPIVGIEFYTGWPNPSCKNLCYEIFEQMKMYGYTHFYYAEKTSKKVFLDHSLKKFECTDNMISNLFFSKKSLNVDDTHILPIEEKR